MENDQLSTRLQEQYQTRFSAHEQYRKKLWQLLTRDFFQQYVDVDNSVLDLGCGWGEFINNISAKNKYALDLNPDTTSKLHADVQFVQHDCAKEWPIEDNALDTVFTSNFLEHLPDKSSIENTLAQAFRCTKPGGKIICMGPNIKFVPGDYWDYWDHHVAITENSLAEALQLQGFQIDTCIDRFLPYTMSGGKQPPLILVSTYLKLRFAWRFFGKQFLVIATKKAI